MLLLFNENKAKCPLPVALSGKNCPVLLHHPISNLQFSSSFLLPRFFSSISSQRGISVLPLGIVVISDHIFLHLIPFISLSLFLLLRSLHPFLRVWAEGGEPLQKGLYVRGPQHHLSLSAPRGHTRWITHRWWHHHHRPHGEYSSSLSE